METYFSVRQALEAVEEQRSETARMRRNVAILEARCTSGTGNVTVGYTGGGGRGDLMDRLCEAREELEEQERRQAELETHVNRWIGLLPRMRWRMVLRWRYLSGMELQEVAEELTKATGRAFSVHQIYRLHRDALLAAEKVWPLQRAGQP